MRDWLPACRLHDVEMELVFATLARTGDAHLLTIFGDRSAGQCEPLFAEGVYQGIVAEWFLLVFLVNQFLQPNADCFPGNIFATCQCIRLTS